MRACIFPSLPFPSIASPSDTHADFAKYSMGESKWARKLKGTDMPISRAAIVIDMCAAAAVCTVFVATTCVFLIPPNPGPNYDSFM